MESLVGNATRAMESQLGEEQERLEDLRQRR
jgi:hypothetical protein